MGKWKVAAFVPAKSTSERIPNKNSVLMDGEPLFRRKLLQLLDCENIDEVWLDTDSEEFICNVSDLPVRILKRRSSLAKNETDGHMLFENEARTAGDADIVVQALATSPFLGPELISRAIEELKDVRGKDSLIAVSSMKTYTWVDSVPTYGYDKIPNSSDLPKSIFESMGLYMMKKSSARYPAKRFGDKPVLYEVSPLEALDINNYEDLQMASLIITGMKQTEAQVFASLKISLDSAILSDTCKELGIRAILEKGLMPTSGGKILGRAKTLQLRQLSPNEMLDGDDSWKGIYDALGHYESIGPGDILCVSSEVHERAYFGELNCSLAIRAGSSGAIIDSYTRDTAAVESTGFPVYSRGPWSNDVKYEGVTESIGKPVEIKGISIRNGDVVFADADGALAVPSSRWGEVLEVALQTLEKEMNIKLEIARGQRAQEIHAKLGDF